MDLFQLIAVLTTLAALSSWVNHQTLRLPSTIGVMAVALIFSMAIVILGAFGVDSGRPLARVVEAIDFDKTLLHGLLGAMLFAGALHVNLNDLLGQKGVIVALATAGMLLSTAVIGAVSWGMFGLLGFEVPFVTCLLFGALVSPTDPIAVLSILKHVAIPKSLEVKIAGESLFNDGFAVVLFLVLLGIASGDHEASGVEIVRLLAVEAAGGIVFGLALGSLAYSMLKSIDDYQVEILITLAVVTGGYALAQALHTSGPLAMVVAGLLIGNRGRRLAMSSQTRVRLDSFWELVDEMLNAVLFLLIGLELLVVTLSPRFVLSGLLAIPVVLAARWLSVALPVCGMSRWRTFSPHAVGILTWGGLRGGISVALALSLPSGPHRDLLVTTTYVVVSFSIIVQGLSMGPLLQRLYPGGTAPASDASR